MIASPIANRRRAGEAGRRHETGIGSRTRFARPWRSTTARGWRCSIASRATMPSLARELRELLEADARADARGLFERPAAADLACADRDRRWWPHAAIGDRAADRGSMRRGAVLDGRAVEGRQIGGYRIVSLIGRGGMGQVFLAERPDVGKRVAVKLLQSELASQDDVRRFLRERRVLAGLEHPNIVPLFDAGVTAEGMPYFAMEFVDGVSIIDYCRRHGADACRARASVPDRLHGRRARASAPDRPPRSEAFEHPRGSRAAR